MSYSTKSAKMKNRPLLILLLSLTRVAVCRTTDGHHETLIRCEAPDLKENQSHGNAHWVKSALFAIPSRISD